VVLPTPSKDIHKTVKPNIYNENDMYYSDEEGKAIEGDVPLSLCRLVDRGKEYHTAVQAEALNKATVASEENKKRNQYYYEYPVHVSSSSSKAVDETAAVVEDEYEKKVSFMVQNGLKWANIWSLLVEVGWKCKKGRELIDYFYIRPPVRNDTVADLVVEYLLLIHAYVHMYICIYIAALKRDLF
jgi:hypothetical protein